MPIEVISSSTLASYDNMAIYVVFLVDSSSPLVKDNNSFSLGIRTGSGHHGDNHNNNSATTNAAPLIVIVTSHWSLVSYGKDCEGADVRISRTTSHEK